MTVESLLSSTLAYTLLNPDGASLAPMLVQGQLDQLACLSCASTALALQDPFGHRIATEMAAMEPGERAQILAGMAVFYSRLDPSKGVSCIGAGT